MAATTLMLLFVAAILAVSSAGPKRDMINFLKSDEYDQEDQPACQADSKERPNKVKVSAHIVAVYGFNPEADRTIRVVMYMREMWNDSRLAPYVSADTTLIFSGRSPAVDLVWRPDTFISSSLDKQQYSAERFLRVTSGGEVYLSQRVFFTNPCHGWPEQYSCIVEIESYGHSARDIEYEWINDQGVVHSGMYDQDGWTLSLARQEVSHEILGTGNYSRVIFELQVKPDKSRSSSTAIPTGSSSTAGPTGSSSTAAPPPRSSSKAVVDY